MIPSTSSTRRVSTIPTAVSSSGISRRGSRINSYDDLSEFVEEIPSAVENIKEVTDGKDAVMSFYYKDSASQVRIGYCCYHILFYSLQIKLMEIFDVTETDPSLLFKEEATNDFVLDSTALW